VVQEDAWEGGKDPGKGEAENNPQYRSMRRRNEWGKSDKREREGMDGLVNLERVDEGEEGVVGGDDASGKVPCTLGCERACHG
jgi:hypothetical protein